MSVLRLDDIEVRFGGVRALDDFSLTIEPGEIHGLIGPNGAGKTTAINVICGLLRPVSGTLALDGRPFVPRPRDLVAARIARTFQTPAIFPDLSAIENVMLGGYRAGTAGVVRSTLLTPAALAEEEGLRARATELLARVGFDGDPRSPGDALSFASHRKLEVARALMTEPRLLLLDEPTAGLGSGEVQAFAALLRRLRGERAMTILLVEHNVPFVFGLCSTVTAMHEGRRIASGVPGEIRRDPAVVASYLGETHGGVPAIARQKVRAAARTDVALDVRALSSGYGATRILREVIFSVRYGEIVALFGRNGAGKSTLLNTILGSPRAWSGSILWEAKPVAGLATDRIIASGIGLVPQERAVIARQSVDDNLLLATFGLRLPRAEFRARRDEMLEKFPRLAQRRTQLAGSLSGGERQMLAIAKVLMRKPRLLMLDEPSVGLAPAIVEELQGIVAALRTGDLPILIAEQNVGWVVPLADRAFLIDTGTIVREGPAQELADSEILAEHYLGA